jgi:hypothetical protein
VCACHHLQAELPLHDLVGENRPLRSKGKTDEAIHLYKQLIDVDPNSKFALDKINIMVDMQNIMQLFNVIDDCKSKGDVSKVILLYQQIIEQYPNSPEADFAWLKIFEIEKTESEKNHQHKHLKPNQYQQKHCKHLIRMRLL